MSFRNIKSNFELVDLEAIREQSMREIEYQRQQEKLTRQLEKIPLRFRDKTFSDYHATTIEQKKVKHLALKFIDTFYERKNEGTCLKFLGHSGTGKTLLSLLIYRSLIEMNFSGHYESSALFLKLLQEKRFESYGAYQLQLNFFIQPDLLILDEITESVSRDGLLAEFEKKLLFEVINARYEQKRSTFIISNRMQTHLITALGESTVDRLNEKSMTLIFNWKSYR